MRAALVAVALLAVALPALAGSPRHTPNFPTDIVSPDLTSLLKALGDPEVADLLKKIANMEPDSGDAVLELVRRGTVSGDEGIRILRALNSSLDDLTLSVNASLLSDLRRLLNSSDTSPEDLKELLETLVALRESGVLSPYDFIALARVLADGFRRVGSSVPAELTYGVLRSLGDLIGIPPAPAGGTGGATGGGSTLLNGLWGIPILKTSLPSVRPPPLGSLLWTALPVALVSVLALCLISRRRGLSERFMRLKTAVGSMLARRGVPTGDDVVSIYWASVRIVERASRVRKLDHLTHREYLASVASSHLALGRRAELVECFREITRLYEVVRFSHEGDQAVAAIAKERFAEMVRSLG